MTKWRFAYVKWNGQVHAHLFDADIQSVKNPLIVYSINVDEAKMSIAELMERYPYKEA